jgi:hypothetical protein
MVAPTKYRNRKTGGYASVKEGHRAQELKLLQQAGAIRNLRDQVEFVLIPKQGKERPCKYFADFTYDEMIVVPVDSSGPLPERSDNGAYCRKVVEDCKGYKKGQAYAVFAIKRKLLLWFHGISIRET